jgi:hypothetical protein
MSTGTTPLPAYLDNTLTPRNAVGVVALDPATGNPSANPPGGTGAAAEMVQGNVPPATSDSGNPLKIGGVANSGLPAPVSIGQRVNAWFSLNGAIVSAAGSRGPATDGSTNTTSSILAADGGAAYIGSYSFVFNGTTWDRARGDVNGAYVIAKSPAGISLYTGTPGPGPFNAAGVNVSYSGSFPYVYDPVGATYVAQRGDASGTYVAGASFFTESSTPLGASASITGAARATGGTSGGVGSRANFVTVEAITDVTGGTVFLQKSTDGGTIWKTVSTSAAVSVGATTLTARVSAGHYRAVFTNGATAQAVFGLTLSFTGA